VPNVTGGRCRSVDENTFCNYKDVLRSCMA
jgi:hypothetical protein